jgi:hypothetical protein
MYEVGACRSSAAFQAQSDISSCTWNLRIIYYISGQWLAPETQGDNGTAWIIKHFKPDQAAALFRAAPRQNRELRVPDWNQLGDLHITIRAKAIPVVLYRSTTCPQIAHSMAQLAKIARADPNPIARDFSPPNPFSPQDSRHYKGFLAQIFLAPSLQGDWLFSFAPSDDATNTSITAPKTQVEPSQAASKTLYDIPNQISADIDEIRQSCTGETVPLPDSLITPPSVSSPASP